MVYIYNPMQHNEDVSPGRLKARNSLIELVGLWLEIWIWDFQDVKHEG
jgi:hypothetical protein